MMPRGGGLHHTHQPPVFSYVTEKVHAQMILGGGADISYSPNELVQITVLH